jgi:hypothetical protein
MNGGAWPCNRVHAIRKNTMNPEAFAQVEQLYHTLLPLKPERRRARLAAVSDAQLRREVERLLAANEQVGTLLQSPAAAAPDAREAAPRTVSRAFGRSRSRVVSRNN